MTTLNIAPTEYTPKVIFDFEKLVKGKYIFEISGESKPEDVREFYDPLLKWLDDLQHNLKTFEEVAGDNRKRKIRLKFRMDYFNSSTAKYFFDIIQKMEEIQTHCHNANIKIIWIYHPKDIDMKESGEEFQSMTKVPFEISVWKEGEN